MGFHGMMLQGFHHLKLARPHCFAVQTREMSSGCQTPYMVCEGCVILETQSNQGWSSDTLIFFFPSKTDEDNFSLEA